MTKTSIVTICGPDDEQAEAKVDIDKLRFTGINNIVETVGGHAFHSKEIIAQLGIDDVELIEPDTLKYIYSTSRQVPDAAAFTIMDMCGPGKKYPNLWVDYEVCYEDDLCQIDSFQQEYLDEIAAAEGTTLSDSEDQILGEAQELFDSACYAADHQRWELCRQRIDKAQKLLIDAFPNVFPTHRHPKTLLEKEG